MTKSVALNVLWPHSKLFYSFTPYNASFLGAIYKCCIVAVILSHTHLSVCSVLLTLRVSPKTTPPLSPILFLQRLCLNNMKIFILSSTPHNYLTYYIIKNVSWNTNCYAYYTENTLQYEELLHVPYTPHSN